ncbi:hypothetical protein EH165_00540 [Nakamurella antarctica]|uniref:Uncharacterized protein n=1 Tax=Nakamurella antarctica TaxID=1902245 RepID=A0A3G8ZHP8_9ACTN|nr:hypothetical protein [Nakamurella antarctica]AZI56879.1 hypothetical protein EH165_00540 [Nakamurella antarctica]
MYESNARFWARAVAAWAAGLIVSAAFAFFLQHKTTGAVISFAIMWSVGIGVLFVWKWKNRSSMEDRNEKEEGSRFD